MASNVGGYRGGDGDVTLDRAALDALIRSPAGPVGQFISRTVQEGTQIAKRNAPVGDRSSKTPGGHPSGWLRSNIGWEVGVDGDGVFGDIVSDAVTSPANPHPGEPYALFNERPDLRPRGVPKEWRDKEGPYLRPALLEAISRVLGGTTYTPTR